MATLQSAILIYLACFFLLFFSTLSIHEEDTTFDRSDFSLASGLCDIFKCLKGNCVTIKSFPFYECQCDAGWKSPFNQSWIPCVLPNCTIDYSCSNVTSPTPAPAPAFSLPGLFNACSYPVCGNGDCIQNSTSSESYECKCYSGYSNMLNKSDGYCLQTCALGASCQGLNISIGGSPQPSPPPPPSLNSMSNQGTGPQPSPSNENTENQGSKQVCVMHMIMMMVTLVLVGLNA